MITNIFGIRAAAKRLKRFLSLGKMHACLLYLKLRRLELGLQIAVAALKCRLLGLQEPKLLTENRRRAVFVDQFFKRFK